MSEEKSKPTPKDLGLTERQQFWLDHLRACEDSGSSAAQYAKDHDLRVTSLYQRKKQFRKRGLLSTPSCTAPSFVKVRSAPGKASEDVLRIFFPNGVRVEWLTSSDDEASQFLQVVANLS